MRAFFLICLLVFGSRSLCAQNKTVDSLKVLLKSAKHDTTRCAILFQMVEFEFDDTIWPKYNLELKLLAEKNCRLLSKSDPLQKKYQKYIGDALNNMGYMAHQQGKLAEALAFHKEGLKIQDEIGDKVGEAATYNNLGQTYKSQGNIPLAIDYISKSLKIQEEIKDTRGMAYSLNNLGLIYFEQGDAEKAIDYYIKSLKLQEKIGDQGGAALAISNIGLVYYSRGDNTKALSYWEKSLKMREETGDKRGAGEVLGNMGSVYENAGDLQKASDIYSRELKLYEETGEQSGIAYALDNLGGIYYKQRNYKKAIDYCSRSLQISMHTGFPAEVRNAAMSLYRIYKTTGNSKSAFENYELYILMRDSLTNQENKRASIKNQLKYEYEKRAAADSVKNTEEQKVKNAQLTAQHAQIKQERFQRYALLIGLVVMLAGLGFVITRFRITQRQKKIIEMQKGRVDEAYEKLHEKNKEILDSIHYAKRIQTALLPNEKYINKNLGKRNG